LRKAAPKAELSSDDRMYVNMGGEITAAAPTGIAGPNVARVQLFLSPPSSRKNHEGYSGILALIGSDLAKESQEAKVEETIPSKSTRRPLADRARAALKRSRRLKN